MKKVIILDEYYKDHLEYFSDRLAKLRVAKDVSAREMSLAIGQTNSYIGALERKHSLPSMTVFFNICDYFGIKPKEFFDDEVEFPAIFSELIETLKGLDEEQLTNINNIAKGLSKNRR
jgi:transcriptional regulator with XRE-family HTH domain